MSVELAATELMVLLVVWLTGWLWRLEQDQAKVRWTVAVALVVVSIIALIAVHPRGKDEPALELMCGGALGLLIMMATRLGRIFQ